MSESKKELIHKAVDETFVYYGEKGYHGHNDNPEIIEDSKRTAEKLVDAKMHGRKGFDYVASIATFLSCESRGCPITLRMAKNSSRIRVKLKDLQKARKIIGAEPKLTAVDWIDGVVRTLKNSNVVPKEREIEIIEKTALATSNIKKPLTPRYKAILAAYRVLKDSDIKVSQEEIGDIFNISPALLRPNYLREKINYHKIKKDAIKLFTENPETLYTSEDLIEILKLENVTPQGLDTSLSHKPHKMGILHLYGPNKEYFGISEICGSGQCDERWCKPEAGWSYSPNCRKDMKGNSKLRFYSKN